MKPFLILQIRELDLPADNEFEAFLKSTNLTPADVKRIRVEKTGIGDISLDDYSGIIVGGSPYDISTPEEKKSQKQKNIEKDFTRLLDKVVSKDFPFIGACSGNGLLGNYCGAKISSKYKEPVSGVDVTLTEDGIKDPLLKGVPKEFRALVGHKEACETVPQNATLLATSNRCPIQMFKVKKNIYATQFHPEADADVFVVRINAYKHYGYFDPSDAEKLIAEIRKEKITHPQKILRNFVKLYAVE